MRSRSRIVRGSTGPFTMFTLYSIGLAAVGLAVAFAFLEAVLAVSRKPQWQRARHGLVVVNAVERRTQSLPFVGKDRRAAQPAATADTHGQRHAA